MLSASASSSRFAALVGVTGLVGLLGAAGALAWALFFGEAPALDRLDHVSGQVKSATQSEGGAAGRTLRLVVERGTSEYELILARADQLPTRDWPLESVRPGDRVIAWYAPDFGTKQRGTLWQLLRGSQRVVAFEDTASRYSERVRYVVPFGVAGILAGAALVAVGWMRHKRSAAPTQPRGS
jgi:hypothetical protein